MKTTILKEYIIIGLNNHNIYIKEIKIIKNKEPLLETTNNISEAKQFSKIEYENLLKDTISINNNKYNLLSELALRYDAIFNKIEILY